MSTGLLVISKAKRMSLPPSFTPQVMKLLDAYLESDEKNEFYRKFKLRDQLRDAVKEWKRASPSPTSTPSTSNAEADHD
jgi:hypothetical protein